MKEGQGVPGRGEPLHSCSHRCPRPPVTLRFPTAARCKVPEHPKPLTSLCAHTQSPAQTRCTQVQPSTQQHIRNTKHQTLSPARRATPSSSSSKRLPRSSAASRGSPASAASPAACTSVLRSTSVSSAPAAAPSGTSAASQTRRQPETSRAQRRGKPAASAATPGAPASVHDRLTSSRVVIWGVELFQG